MAEVSYDSATCIYPGADRPAVDALQLPIKDGEFVVMVGPSGCGKTTALRMLAGLEEIDDGSIRIDGKDMVGVPSRDRDIAMVFQNYALYPSKTVGENMGFSLKMHGVPKDERARRVRDAAKILDLEPLLDRKPRNLSGGQRQRVAMGRAIVREPKVFCMDEPLSNLDAQLRVQTRTQIAELQRRLKVTTVYVTHDQVEAMTMGERVAVGVRPEHLSVGGDGELTLEVALVEDLGSDSYIYGRLPGDPDSHVIVRATRDHPRPGEVVKVKVDTAHLHLFDGATGLRVGE